jgi:hypothetical protein
MDRCSVRFDLSFGSTATLTTSCGSSEMATTTREPTSVQRQRLPPHQNSRPMWKSLRLIGRSIMLSPPGRGVGTRPLRDARDGDPFATALLGAPPAGTAEREDCRSRPQDRGRGRGVAVIAEERRGRHGQLARPALRAGADDRAGGGDAAGPRARRLGARADRRPRRPAASRRGVGRVGVHGIILIYGIRAMLRCEGYRAICHTRCVCARKSSGFAVKMFGTKRCGLRS